MGSCKNTHLISIKDEEIFINLKLDFMKIKTTDPIVRKAIEMLDQRSQKGFETYKVSLHDDERTFGEWIIMAIEEHLDAVNYLLKIKDVWEQERKT